MKHSLFLLTILALASGCGGDESPAGKMQNVTPKIEGYVVKPQHIEENVLVTGTLMASEQVALMPEISGRITQLHLPEGQHVSKGTLLVKLYDADLQAQLLKLQVQVKTAQSTQGRLEELVKINGVSREEYDQAVTQVASLQADVANVNAQIEKTEIRAPFNGTIGLRNVSEGAYVSPGTTLATIRADEEMKVDFNVPESYVGSIQKGQEISFTINGDTTQYNATVAATEQGVDQGSLSLKARAIIKEHSSKLLPGGSATVSLGLNATDKALVVPTQAIIPQARFKNVIVSRGGKAVFAKVVLGVRRPSDVQIVSGLNPGDTIVTTGIQFIRPGAALKFTSVK